MAREGFELEGEETPNYEGATFPPPRDFQVTAHEALRQGVRDKHKAQMVMSPTGSGKTYLGLRICHEALEKGRTATFLCDRITLINQTSETADRFGLGAHGIIQADHWRYRPSMPFQVASVHTLKSREWPKHHVLVVDEAHTLQAATLAHIAQTDACVIGLSATPFTKGLGQHYTNLVNAATMHELVQKGILVPLRVLTCTKANMIDAATSGGEWTEKAAAERGLAIVGSVITEWQQYASDRKTIVFGATIAHCEELARKFNEAGVMAAVFCSTTTTAQREAILKEYRKPDSVIRVLVSVEALAKGFDVVDVGCIVDCRPLRKSLSTFMQMVGRGLRSSPGTGKTHCLLLDHTGNILRFAKDFERIYFDGLKNLHAGETLDSTVRKDDEDGAVKEPGKCPKCGYTPFLSRCMACGHKKERAAAVEHEAGQGMTEVMIGKVKLADDRRHLFDQIATYCRSHGNPETAKGRALHAFKDITGTFPPDWMRYDSTRNVEVSKAVVGQMRHRLIKFVRGRTGAAA